jgi:hypothetical protein
VFLVNSTSFRACSVLRWKGSLLTDTTLAPVFRLRHDAVPSVATRLVVRWDRETGWAHLAFAVPGAKTARFAGFHQFSAGGADTVVAELAAAGCVTGVPSPAADGLMAIEAVLAGEVADACR